MITFEIMVKRKYISSFSCLKKKFTFLQKNWDAGSKISMGGNTIHTARLKNCETFIAHWVIMDHDNFDEFIFS